MTSIYNISHSQAEAYFSPACFKIEFIVLGFISLLWQGIDTLLWQGIDIFPGLVGWLNSNTHYTYCQHDF